MAWVEGVAQGVCALAAAGKAPFLAISELVRERGWPVDELTVEAGRLDEVFRQITMGPEEASA